MATILYVDDDKEMTLAVQDALTHGQHRVTVVNSGPDGWSHIKSNSYDLIILDWEMPDLNGVDILKLMRSAGDTTPVIMMTARGALDDKIEGLDSGANDYLTKPINPEELGARVRAVLRTKSAPPPPPRPLGVGNEAVLERGGLAGTTLAAHFEFVEVIGDGGAALVFKARHPQLQKFVAVKMLHCDQLSGDAISRFVQEARIASNLEHPNIVTVYDFGITEHQQPYMVMELIDGPSLYKVIQQREYLPLLDALPILIASSAALAYAHDLGILHRDIKPDNIALKQVADQPPIPKILDFGLARILEMNGKPNVNLTQGHIIFGSPPYMSPEQVSKKPVDERSDVYSFGCAIFEVLTGFAPFCGDDPLEVALKRLEEAPLTFAEARPEVNYPPAVEQLVARALAKDPAGRYQTMHELHEDLLKISTQSVDQSIWSRLRKIKLFGP